MTGYNIQLTNGTFLETINVKTIDNKGHTSLILIGQGIPNYGTNIAEDLVWLMENFSNSSAPVHPLVGQEWHDNVNDRINYFSTSGVWRPLLSPKSSFAAKFDMLAGATNIDFTSTHGVAIFTGPDPARTYLPHSFILVPNGAITAGTPASINLTASVTGDVLSTTSVSLGLVDQYVRISLNATPRMVTATHPTITLNITTAATGGALHYDAYLFGFTI